MREFKPPAQIEVRGNPTMFLAGTIDMGTSEDWQAEIAKRVKDTNVDIFNPRRSDWNTDWEQKFEEPNFYHQVMWELDAMHKADIIIMNFLKTSKSPITLLELGLFATSGKLYVCCPDEFYRSGNVHIICNNYSIPLFKDMNELLNYLKL